VALGFADDDGRSLEAAAAAFLEGFLVLAGLPIAAAMRGSGGLRGATDGGAYVGGNAAYTDILKASQMQVNWTGGRGLFSIARKTMICVVAPPKSWHLFGCGTEICSARYGGSTLLAQGLGGCEKCAYKRMPILVITPDFEKANSQIFSWH